ncbi:MAG: hypothetical protein ACKOI2_02330 [Actinomycetota bacterium]
MSKVEETKGRSDSSAEFRDRLPDELVAITHSDEYSFPDNSRRRIPGIIYLVTGFAVTALALIRGDEGPFVNSGLVAGAVLLIAFGVYSVSSGWRMRVDEQEALAAAGSAVGFEVGHASAQQVWRGLRSRPTWRVLCYSSENPPRQRGLVLVDAVSGLVLEHMTQDNEEDWSKQ